MNKKERLTKFREIFTKYKEEEFVNKEDFDLLIFLFKNHPNWKTKEGCGIEKIKVRKDHWKKKAFMLIRKDGSTTDISIIVASNGYADSDIKRIKNACRYHIKDEILKFKDTIRLGTDRCPITNKILTQENIHIDHHNLTFEELFNKWIKNFDINFLISNLNDSSLDNVIYDWFINEEIINNFIKFHNENTHLRAVTKNANLSILKKRI